MSDYLTKKIQIGDRIMITGPLGHMIDDKKHDKYLLVSTGSGVSPMVGLLTELMKNPNNMIVNIFGERYYKHMLGSVENIFSIQTEKVKNILFLSQEDKEGYRRGHVQLALDESIERL